MKPAVALPLDRRLPSVECCAGAQVGKTTALLALAQELTAEGSHVAVLLSMEQGRLSQKDPGAAERAILDAWRDRSRARLPPDLQPPPWPDAAPGNRMFASWAKGVNTSQRVPGWDQSRSTVRW